MDLVPHGTDLLAKRLNLERQAASLQSLPVIKQLALSLGSDLSPEVDLELLRRYRVQLDLRGVQDRRMSFGVIQPVSLA